MYLDFSAIKSAINIFYFSFQTSNIVSKKKMYLKIFNKFVTTL